MLRQGVYLDVKKGSAESGIPAKLNFSYNSLNCIIFSGKPNGKPGDSLSLWGHLAQRYAATRRTKD